MGDNDMRMHNIRDADNKPANNKNVFAVAFEHPAFRNGMALRRSQRQERRPMNETMYCLPQIATKPLPVKDEERRKTTK